MVDVNQKEPAWLVSTQPQSWPRDSTLQSSHSAASTSGQSPHSHF